MVLASGLKVKDAAAGMVVSAAFQLCPPSVLLKIAGSIPSQELIPVVAYIVLGFVGSIAKSEKPTHCVNCLNAIRVQVAPPSVLLERPGLPVLVSRSAYSVGGVVGAIARKLRTPELT